MKRTFIYLFIVAIVLGLGWLLPHSLFSVTWETPIPSLPAPDKSTTPAETTASASVPAPTQTAAIPDGIQAAYQNLSFVIPVGMASGAEGEMVPANPDLMTYSTAYIHMTLTDFPVIAPPPNDYYKAEVRVYPAAEYVAINIWADTVVQRLQNVLANPTAPMLNETLPYPPYRGTSAQLYAAQAKIVDFQNGSGVRMISSYAQYPAPIEKSGSIYHYEGLTRDGKYLLVVDLPVILPVYSDQGNPGENGIVYPANYQGWPDVVPYYLAMTNLLNRYNPDAYNLSLTQLDALVQSIHIGDIPLASANGPTTAAPIDPPCPAELEGTKLLINPDAGYCLLVPAQDDTTIPGYVVINPLSRTADTPGDAWVSIAIEAAAGRTAAQIAEEQIAAVGAGFNIRRSEFLVDGEPAIVVDGLPNVDSSRKVLIVHNDRLYTLLFMPWFPDAVQPTPLENLFGMVMDSLRFLP